MTRAPDPSRRPGRSDRRPRRALVLLIGLALASAGCTAGSSGSRTDGASSRATGGPAQQTCTVDARGVPDCGVLWGVSTNPPTLDQLGKVESAAGRPFDLVYRYHDVDGQIPDAPERRVVAQGRLLHVAIAARKFGRNAGDVSWADVARGDFDDTLSAQARGVASLKRPVFVTFAQEANQKDKLGVNGTAAEFRQAWRHLHDLYVAAGATNAVWTWVMTGNADNLDRAASLWPGNDVVDWISWNVYNQSGCHSGVNDQAKFSSFEDELSPFYDFVRSRGPSIGMDPDKPMMISETGSVTYAEQPQLTADWYAAIPSTLRKYPQVKAVTVWDSVATTCDYDFDTSPTVTRGVRSAGLDPDIDMGRVLTPGG